MRQLPHCYLCVWRGVAHTHTHTKTHCDVPLFSIGRSFERKRCQRDEPLAKIAKWPRKRRRDCFYGKSIPNQHRSISLEFFFALNVIGRTPKRPFFQCDERVVKISRLMRKVLHLAVLCLQWNCDTRSVCCTNSSRIAHFTRLLTKQPIHNVLKLYTLHHYIK